MLHRDEQALREYLPVCRALADTLEDLVRSEGRRPVRAGGGLHRASDMASAKWRGS